MFSEYRSALCANARRVGQSVAANKQRLIDCNHCYSMFMCLSALAMVIAVLFLFLAGFSAAAPRCLQLKHSSSALVDCGASQSVVIFAQPFCKNAHIVTLDSSSCNNYIAVALLGSASFSDLLQTACHQQIPTNITLPDTIELPQLCPADRSICTAGIPCMNLFPLC